MSTTVKKKKKNGKALSLILLLVALAGLFLVYKAVVAETANADGETGVTDEDVIMLIQRPASEVAAISYTADGVTYDFICAPNTGVWMYSADAKFPLNQTPVASMASVVCQIGAIRHLEEGDNGEYGFDSPALTISAQYTDGAQYTYAIGDLNRVTGTRYFKDLDTGEVYTVSDAIMSYFDYTLPDLFQYDTLPADIDPAYITSVTLCAAGEEKEFTDGDACTALYGLFTGLAPTEYADWYADEAEKTAYGIGSLTMTIRYKRSASITDESGNTNTMRIPAEYTVYFGNTAGESVYYMLSGSDVVYTVSSDKVNAILQYEAAETAENE